ncbi:hypothetical protein FTW19_00130 [Terriglobus albidus]|uniref:Uncharacterized protein n=1 Tax=Terriglobus albidus TaxID=1592106 RepID=A0A5B9E2M2_9BACT|nr:hypothetical protein [Terriglobus albidus]QEE26553.1 hypothetical protein FTW19_00130 [Terriglobus albidus]
MSWIRADVKEMQVKVFHGTNSITYANGVLPTFIMRPGRFKPEGNANKQNPIQIVDTRNAPDVSLQTSAIKRTGHY